MWLISLVSSSAAQPLVERVCCATLGSARYVSLSLQTSVKQKEKVSSERVSLGDYDDVPVNLKEFCGCTVFKFIESCGTLLICGKLSGVPLLIS